MAHMLDVGLSSTDHIAAFFGIAPAPAESKVKRPAAEQRPKAAPPSGPQGVIEDALRAAGLMR
jgi:hypothetical protein